MGVVLTRGKRAFHWVSGDIWSRSQGSIPMHGCRLLLVYLWWDFLAECSITVWFSSQSIYSLPDPKSLLWKRTPTVALVRTRIGKAKSFWWWHVRGTSFCLMKPHEETFITGRDLKHWPLPGETQDFGLTLSGNYYFSVYLSLVFWSIGDYLLYEQTWTGLCIWLRWINVDLSQLKHANYLSARNSGNFCNSK